MKGLYVYGATLGEGRGVLTTTPITYPIAGTTQPTAIAFERPNCTDGQDVVMCPAGQVLAGVNVQHGEAPGDKRQAMGLSAYCAPITIE